MKKLGRIRFMMIQTIGLLLFLSSCTVPKDYNYTKLEVCNVTIQMDYLGKIQLCVPIPQKDGNYRTFIMTDLVSLTIYGKHEIPINTKTYIIYKEPKNRTTATFYWEGERQSYEIVR